MKIDKILQSKDINWLNTYKTKTHIYTAYKGLTYTSKDMHRLNVRGGKSHFT